jgi:hypothetical protein
MNENRLSHVDEPTLSRMKLACERVLPYLKNTKSEDNIKNCIETIQNEQKKKEYKPNEYYAYALNKGRCKEGEHIVAQDAKYSYLYAKDVLFGRFVIGEHTISQSPKYSYLYAYDIINGRWELGENAISQDILCAYSYAKLINSKLPENMHNKMIAHGITDSENLWLKEYFELIEQIEFIN